jgi:hypothetical protein
VMINNEVNIRRRDCSWNARVLYRERRLQRTRATYESTSIKEGLLRFFKLGGEMEASPPLLLYCHGTRNQI